MKLPLSLVLLIFFSISGFAQTPTISPDFFAADEEITITYDVTGTALSSLDEAWLWLWIPNLGSFNAPSNINPADSNPALTDAAKLTKSSEGGKQIFTITLTLTDFVGKSKEEITSVGMLIKGNDWADGQTPDFTLQITDGFTLRLDKPSGQYGFYLPGQTINVEAKVSEPADLTIFIDEMEVASMENMESIGFSHSVIDDGQVHHIRVTATTGTESDEVNYSYAVNLTPAEIGVPEGARDGINYHDDKTVATLVLTAPGKDNVFVIGDFNNWALDSDFLMNKDGDQFWLDITGLEEGKEYIFQYLVDGKIRIADPYAEKISSPFDDPQVISENRYPGLREFPEAFTSEEASYLMTGKTPYEWQDGDFQRPAKEDLIIYELLIRDFTEERNYNAVIEKLDYLANLGVNAIELLPVTEFEGNLSWGYNPSFMFATDKYYGTENELKKLVDEAHKRGIAIIFDIVLNHAFGRSPLARLDNDDLYGPPTANNVWLNREAKHDFNVGYDFNHESEYTKNYVDRVVEYWIEEYHADGYRFDLSKGFTQRKTIGNQDAFAKYDQSRVDILTRIADVTWAKDPDAYVILEHFADNAEEKVLANYGMMLWGNVHGTFISAAKGNSTSLRNLSHESKGWDSPHLVGYMESHDEERVTWDLLKSRSLEYTLQRLKLNAAFFFTVPGPKMLWQFGEMGYDVELNDDRLGIKPTKWEYLEDEERKNLHDTYTSLINLRTKTDLINTDNFSWDTEGRVKWIKIDASDVKMSIIGNFAEGSESTVLHVPNNGTWYDYFSGEEVEVTDFANQTISLAPGDFRIYTSEPIENYLDDNPTEYILSLQDQLEYESRVFPNPFKDKIVIQGERAIETVQVKDLTGRSYIVKASGLNTKTVELDLNKLSPGVYILEYESDKTIIKQRIVKGN